MNCKCEPERQESTNGTVNKWSSEPGNCRDLSWDWFRTARSIKSRTSASTKHCSNHCQRIANCNSTTSNRHGILVAG